MKSKIFSIVFAAAISLSLPLVASATSYLPGQTLNPSCPPSDATCVVVANTAGTFVATSTTATSTFAGNVSISGTTAIGSLSGILKAVAGVITTALVNLSSDVTGILGITNGGTGTSTVPTLGQVLVGNGAGGYTLTATSSLGIAGTASQWTTGGSNIFFNTGFIGIGTTTPTALLTVDSTSTAGSILRLSNGSAGGHIFDLLSTGSSNTGGAGRLDIFDTTAGLARLSIAANGNVGVGTTSPFAKFAVNGSAYLSGSLNVGDASTTRFNLGLPYATNADASLLTYTNNSLGGFNYSVFTWGDSLTSANGTSGTDGQIPYPTQLGALAGFSINLGGIGGQGSGLIASRMLAATSTWSMPTIIWAGRNDYSTPSTVEANIASMVAALQSVGNNDYLVLSVINGDYSTEYTGQTNYNTIIGINSYLATTYGSHYVDVRSYLVSLYNPSSPIDVIDHGNDVPPSSLRAVLKSGTLSGSIGASDTSFTLNYTTGSLTVGDIVDIDGEKILVGSGSSGSSVTNATRGYFGTTATSHTSGASFYTYDQLHLSSAGYGQVAAKILQNEDALLGTSRVNTSAVTPQELRKALNNFGAGYFQNYLPVLNSSSTAFSTTVGIGAANGLLSSATYDTAIGNNALFTATSTTYTTAVGVNALYYNTTGIKTSAFGALALQTNTTGSSNDAFGYQSLFANTTGSNNAAFGYGALGANTTASFNAAFGNSAASANTTGTRNTAVGASALVSNTTGADAVAVGGNALFNNTVANFATALGYQAAVGGGTYSNQGGVYLGFQAGDKAATGSDYNTFIGYQAGYGVTTGTRNIVIGPSTVASSFNGLATGSFNILIGNDIALATTTLSNQLDIGNLIYGTGINGTGTALSTGSVAIGTTTPYSKLEVWGPDTASTSAFAVVNSASTTEFTVYDTGNAVLAGSLTQNSDQRLKTNIQNLDASSSLAAINELNPVTFNWIDPNKSSVPQYGFIAQQVQSIFPNLVSVTAPTALTPDGTLSLNYIDLVSPIVKAIQALSGEIASVETTVAGFAQSITSAVGNFGQVNAQQLNASTLCLGSTCVTQAQLQALLTASKQSAGSPASPSASIATDTPPVIEINGNNPATVQVGSTYTDLGANITGPSADLNLDIATYLNGSPMSPILIDTSAAATDTIDYVVTDSNGLTSTSTRTVIIPPAAAATSSPVGQ